MRKLIAGLMLVCSVSAVAGEIKHPNINPDVLHDLFMTATLVECDGERCWNAVTDAPHEKITATPGLAVVFDPATLERLALTPEEFNIYKAPLGDLMHDVADQLDREYQ